MADFNSQDPPKSVTGGAPKNAVVEYPKHLHKSGGQYVVVTNAAEEADQIAQGWSVKVPVEPKAHETHKAPKGTSAPVTPEAPVWPEASGIPESEPEAPGKKPRGGKHE